MTNSICSLFLFLVEMGVRLPSSARMPFAGIAFIDGAAAAAARFTEGTGWGVRRTRLSAALRARAEQLGAELRYGTPVLGFESTRDRVLVHTGDGMIEGRLLVGADGLHSAVRRWIGAPSRSSTGRFGMRRHFAVAPWSRFVEVHWGDGFEAYVTPVGSEEVGVALLWSGRRADYDELLRRLPHLAARLRGARPVSEIRGAGPMRQEVARIVAPRVALVGDAAGYRDALTGEGITSALRSARLLVDTIVRDESLAGYEAAHRRLTRGYRVLTQAVLEISYRPRLRRRLAQTLAHEPAAFDEFVAVLTGDRPLGIRTLAQAGRLAWRRLDHGDEKESTAGAQKE